MEKQIANKEMSYCPMCEKRDIAIVLHNKPICELCGNQNLLDIIGMNIFIPFYEHFKTYKASSYTPSMPDRREDSRSYPIIRDRRANAS